MLSYCTNIHPAESWAETREAIHTCVPRIRQELAALNSPLKDRPLGIGLRLSARAAAELLETPHAVEALKSWLNEHDARVETLNGFPYGNFHGQRVKEHVFQPDWTTPERFEYTCNLFRILALIGDENADRLTVSTLPASHSWFHADEERIFSRLDAMSGFLDVLSRQTGRLMQLGLEPEPFGHFHDTEGAIRFFNGLRNHSRRPGLIERHLGLTYDTCHFAILREEPAATLSAWEENNISLCKVQFSNALECRIRGEEDLERLRQFDDGVYFHQTSIFHRDRTMIPGPAERPGLRAGLCGGNAGFPMAHSLPHPPVRLPGTAPAGHGGFHPENARLPPQPSGPEPAPGGGNLYVERPAGPSENSPGRPDCP